MHLRALRADDVAPCVEIMRLTHLGSDYPIYWPADPAGFLCSNAMIQAWVAVDDDAAVARSFELGQHPILNVTKNTEDAILFYESLGWQRVGSLSIELPIRPDIEMWVYLAPTPSTDPHQ